MNEVEGVFKADLKVVSTGNLKGVSIDDLKRDFVDEWKEVSFNEVFLYRFEGSLYSRDMRVFLDKLKKIFVDEVEGFFMN